MVLSRPRNLASEHARVKIDQFAVATFLSVDLGIDKLVRPLQTAYRNFEGRLFR
jgi:hypothetical protein